jgi:hypothetical protein
MSGSMRIIMARLSQSRDTLMSIESRFGKYQNDSPYYGSSLSKEVAKMAKQLHQMLQMAERMEREAEMSIKREQRAKTTKTEGE